MKCILEGNSVKAFGKAIHALSRIGEDLWLDPMVKGLALRSVNSSHTAYACFLFSPMFFHQYNLELESNQDRETIECKLVTKSVLPLFRGLTSLERNVERCEISISAFSDRVIIKFICRHGITKTHNVRYQECKALQAEFASHLCPNVLKTSSRLLGDMVMHFSMSQEEITLSMTAESIKLKSYYDKEYDRLKMMCTELSLHPDEFDFFQVGVDSDITFCLKELRGLLSFAESHCLPVSVHFGTAGKPVCFSVEDMVLEANVVLATLTDCDSSQSAEAPCCATPRCGDPVALPVDSHQAESNTPRKIPDLTEVVPSSQGSPIVNSPDITQLLSKIYNPIGLFEPDEGRTSVATTPASSVICPLFFAALSSEQDGESCPDGLPILACYSEEDEDMVEEDCPRSPPV